MRRDDGEVRWSGALQTALASGSMASLSVGLSFGMESLVTTSLANLEAGQLYAASFGCLATGNF